jgi:hypothetical protein
MPNHFSKQPEAWCSSMPRPSETARPRARLLQESRFERHADDVGDDFVVAHGRQVDGEVRVADHAEGMIGARECFTGHPITQAAGLIAAMLGPPRGNAPRRAATPGDQWPRRVPWLR